VKVRKGRVERQAAKIYTKMNVFPGFLVKPINFKAENG
jgi:hypothetical protein